jgi:phage shock protein C
MTDRRTTFYLDKLNAKWLGVCSGIAEYTGFDVTIIRLTTIVLTFATFPMFLFVYLIAAWLAPVKPVGLYDSPEDAKFWQGVRASPSRSTSTVASPTSRRTTRRATRASPPKSTACADTRQRGDMTCKTC